MKYANLKVENTNRKCLNKIRRKLNNTCKSNQTVAFELLNRIWISKRFKHRFICKMSLIFFSTQKFCTSTEICPKYRRKTVRSKSHCLSIHRRTSIFRTDFTARNRLNEFAFKTFLSPFKSIRIYPAPKPGNAYR